MSSADTVANAPSPLKAALCPKAIDNWAQRKNRVRIPKRKLVEQDRICSDPNYSNRGIRSCPDPQKHFR